MDEIVSALSLDATDSMTHWYSPYNNDTIKCYSTPHAISNGNIHVTYKIYTATVNFFSVN